MSSTHKKHKAALKTSLISASLALLSGCASQFQDYEGTAQRVALANICEREGYLSYEAFSSYSSFQFGGYAHQWIVDQNKLNSMYLNEVQRSSSWKPSTQREQEELKMRCAEIATVAQRVSPNNAAQQQNSSSYQYTAPKTTNCMTTYGYTRCTTY